MQFGKTRPLHVAIIGAGPAGFYAAQALTKQSSLATADIFERLPSPYGLVRYGVAPDHSEVKSKANAFDLILRHKRVRYFGNVTFGEDLTHEEIKAHYDAVIYTVGASLDRSLSIPGEDLAGSLSATEFIAWYNAHPEHAELNPPLDMKHAAVVGMGNVALDVTRTLLKDPAELDKTDMAAYAVEALRRSQVTDVHILGRRGPSQASFTPKELREVAELPGVEMIVDPADIAADKVGTFDDDRSARNAARNLELFTVYSKGYSGHLSNPEAGMKRVHIHFFVSPIEVLGEARVQGLKLERNRLEQTGDRLSARGTGEFGTLNISLLLRSVGYRSKPLDGVPFDDKRGLIPNIGGRVTTLEGDLVDREYTSGWVRRGPSGVIGTNKTDAEETVGNLLRDAPTQTRGEVPPDVTELLERKGIEYVTAEAWQRILNTERRSGGLKNRRSLKFSKTQDMLAVLELPGQR